MRRSPTGPVCDALPLDTSVAIPLRDKDPLVSERVRSIGNDVLISIVTRVELEGGVYRDATYTNSRRIRLDAFLRSTKTLDFRSAEADAYQRIVASRQFSRRKLLDRMIAAQALVAGATLVTLNGADFRDVPGLTLLEW